MKLTYLAAISTGTVIALGLVMLLPVFTLNASSGSPSANSPMPVILSFSISHVMKNEENTTEWCKSLSEVFDKHAIKATIFVSGNVAEAAPECVSSFSSKIDIGSQTYSYVNLTDIGDYSRALKEVQEGKRSVDKIGKLNSGLFRAPYDSTDDNIYSLLRRAEIVADFSYSSQYNKYENEMFIKYDLSSYTWDEHRKYEDTSKFLQHLLSKNHPIAINFDNTTSILQIDDAISNLKADKHLKIRLVNASELVGINLTVREVEHT